MKTHSHLIALVALLLPPAALAQPVLSTAGASSTPAAPSAAEPSSLADSDGGDFASGRAASLPLFQFGPFALRPHASEQYTYSDGLSSQPGVTRSSHVNRFALGLLTQLGQSWSLDYTYSWVNYTESSFRDSADQSLTLHGAVSRNNWSANLTSSYASRFDVLVETARQTATKQSTTALAGTVSLGRRLSLQTVATQNLNFIEGSPDWYQWTVAPSLQYRFSDTIDLSLGASTGYVAIYKSADMAFIQPYVQIAWSPTRKTSVSIRGGLEERKMLGGSRTWRETPILSASVRYQAFENTSVSLQANRQVSPSYVQRQTVDTQSWSVGVSQRLLKRFNVHAGMSGQQADYLESLASDTAERRDKTRSFDTGISTRVFSQGSVGVFYSRSHNRTNAQGFGFVSHQVGVRAAYSF